MKYTNVVFIADGTLTGPDGVYKGVPELLLRLKDAGAGVYCAGSPEARETLRRAGLEGLLGFIDMSAAEKLTCAILIGTAAADVLTAHRAGLPCAGLNSGDPEGMLTAGAEAVCGTPDELLGFLSAPSAVTERLKRQLDFILEIDREKNILRQTHLSGHGRRENDAEHAWHMAIAAYLLKEYANAPVDAARVMLMCLIHDVVEIDAGDTYAYDAEGLKTQKAREEAAKQRIYSLLPPDQAAELMGIFDEFEASATPEARFAHALDNLQPLLLNDSNDGGDWREHEVRVSQVYRRQAHTNEGSRALYEVTDALILKNVKNGNIKV